LGFATTAPMVAQALRHRRLLDDRASGAASWRDSGRRAGGTMMPSQEVTS